MSALRWDAWPVDSSKIERSLYHFPLLLLLLTMTEFEVLPSNVLWCLSFFEQNWGALLLLTIEVDNSLVPMDIRDIHLYKIKRNH